MNIYQKLAAITAELQTVAKNLNVDTGNGRSYKAVSERDILDAVKPIEQKHGVYSFPLSRETLESERLEQETKYGVKTSFYTRIKTVYRFVNTDKPDDYIDTVTFSVGLDSGDKGDGKAMTYGDKYALMKAYKISTGDDPDQQASVEAKYTASRQTVIDQICSLGISRTELDQTIRSKYPNDTALTLPIEKLQALKAYFSANRREQG